MADTNKPKEEPKSVFGKGEGITRREFRHVLKENREGSAMNASERKKIEKNDFSARFGPKISVNDVKKSAYELHKKLLDSATSDQEKIKIKKEVDYLKKISKL